jgi:hypothetical protein
MELWNRLFRNLGFDPACKPKVYCDNAQTVGIVNKETHTSHGFGNACRTEKSRSDGFQHARCRRRDIKKANLLAEDVAISDFLQADLFMEAIQLEIEGLREEHNLH